MFNSFDFHFVKHDHDHNQPFEDIFQFFEDGMTVRIGQAIGSADYMTSGLLIRWAVLGGFISGLIGAVSSTILTFIPPIFGFFVPTTTKTRYQQIVQLYQASIISNPWPDHIGFNIIFMDCLHL